MINNLSFGIPDCEFIRGEAPMTKEEVRVISLSKLRLNDNSVLLDIGAGTGSVSIEAARLMTNGSVIAIEVIEESIELIKKNIEKFRLNNIKIIHGMAPKSINHLKNFDRVFVGGSKGNIKEILKYVYENISLNGRIVVNAITIETVCMVKDFLVDVKNDDAEIICVNISKNRKIGSNNMMEALNPVYIISFTKEDL